MMKKLLILSALVFFAAQANALDIHSEAFKHKGYLPDRYTCDGADISVPLSWSGAPKKTKSFVLICDDPDAPFTTWTHWVVYNIPADARGIPEGGIKGRLLAEGAYRGINDFGELGYGGACPPKGKPHRYYFKLYALDAMLGLSRGANKKEVERAMVGHILAEAGIYGLYQRK